MPADRILTALSMQSTLLLAVTCATLSSSCSICGKPSPCPELPATGQTTTYKADKNDGVAGPVGVPDDGSIRAGAKLAYADNGNGTITDVNTGLMWEKKSADVGPHDRDQTFVWSGTGTQPTIWDWVDQLNGAGFAGHNDWRIPNAKELQSIVDYEANNPSVAPVFNAACVAGCAATKCSCTASDIYWSSTTLANPTDIAVFVEFNNGLIAGSLKDQPQRVRAVRGPH